MDTIIHERKEKKDDLPELVTRPFTVNIERRKVDLANFIYVPQNKVFITRLPFGTAENRLTWEAAQYFLADLGLFMPTIGIFMNHYVNVRDVSQGRSEMHKADGKEVTISDAFYMWQKMNEHNKNGPTCASWLDNTWTVQKSTEYGKSDKVTMYEDHRLKYKKESLELKGKSSELEIPEREYRSSIRLPESGDIVLEWVDRDKCALGLTVEFESPKHDMATQYLSGKIDCTKDKKGFTSHLFGCAYSTKRLK